MATTPHLSPLMRDLAAIDALALSSNRQVGPPPIPVIRRIDDDPASGAVLPPIVSDPREPVASDHFRVSSPNRNRGNDDTTMRHRRLKRSR